MARFACPWDRSLKTTTCCGVALLLAAGTSIAALPWIREGDLHAVPLLLAGPAGALALVLGTWLLGPRAVVVSPSEVRVVRPILPVVIPVRAIRAVQVLPPDALRGSLRTFGASGFFGHCGRFWSRHLGTFRMYSTSTQRLVLLETDGGRVVLSPFPAEGFADAVRALHPERAPGRA